MSGLVNGLKKVFKKVGNFVKKVAPIALIAGVAIATGGFGLLAAPGAAVGGAAGGGGLGGWITSLFSGGGAAATAVTGAVTTAPVVGGGGLLGGLGTFLTSEAGGALISGAAAGYGTHLDNKQQEQMTIDAENRRSASYEGSGAAASFRGNGLGSTPAPQRTMAQQAPSTSPSNARPSVTATMPTVTPPRYQYDPETRKIVYS